MVSDSSRLVFRARHLYICQRQRPATQLLDFLVEHFVDNGGSHNHSNDSRGSLKQVVRKILLARLCRGYGVVTRDFVGDGRFELPASTSRTWRATKLR